MDRGQPRVAGAHAVAALGLEVVEEAGDQRRVEIDDVQPRWWDPGALAGEAEQQPQRVAVGGDGVSTGVSLPDQPVGEERLQGRGERTHRSDPRWASSRVPATAISSGEADRYQ